MATELRDSSDYRRRLEAWLPTLDAAESEDQLRIHLGDLHGACAHVLATLEKLPALSSANEAELRRTLADLNGELYEHLVPHLKALRPHLDAVVRQRYREAERRGEL